jgi:hypothetical protein
MRQRSPHLTDFNSAMMKGPHSARLASAAALASFRPQLLVRWIWNGATHCGIRINRGSSDQDIHNAGGASATLGGQALIGNVKK